MKMEDHPGYAGVDVEESGPDVRSSYGHSHGQSKGTRILSQN
jgi:hypothetical protein